MSKNACLNIDPDPDYQALWTSEDFNPERRLLAAVLYRAIVDCVGTAQMSKKARRSAEAFIFGECDSPLTFEYVCGELDLKPRVIQEMVKDIQEGQRMLPLLAGQKRH